MFPLAKCPVCDASEWLETAAYPPYRWSCANCYALAWFVCPDEGLITSERGAAQSELESPDA